MKILTINAQGLRGSYKDFLRQAKKWVQNGRCHVIIVQEHNLSEANKQEDTRAADASGFKILISYIQGAQRTQGVCILAHKDHVPAIEWVDELEGHTLIADITWQGRTIKLAGIHGPRPPLNSIHDYRLHVDS